MEDIEYHSDRKLDKVLISKLSTGTYIQDKHNIIILGASGAGKTYMACAFGIALAKTSSASSMFGYPICLMIWLSPMASALTRR